MSLSLRKKTGQSVKAKVVKFAAVTTTVSVIVFGILFGPKVYETSKKQVHQVKNKVTHTVKSHPYAEKNEVEINENEQTKDETLFAEKLNEKAKQEVFNAENELEGDGEQPSENAFFDSSTNQIVVDSDTLKLSQEKEAQKKSESYQNRIGMMDVKKVSGPSLLISPQKVKTDSPEKDLEQPESKGSSPEPSVSEILEHEASVLPDEIPTSEQETFVLSDLDIPTSEQETFVLSDLDIPTSEQETFVLSDLDISTPAQEASVLPDEIPTPEQETPKSPGVESSISLQNIASNNTSLHSSDHLREKFSRLQKKHSKFSGPSAKETYNDFQDELKKSQINNYGEIDEDEIKFPSEEKTQNFSELQKDSLPFEISFDADNQTEEKSEENRLSDAPEAETQIQKAKADAGEQVQVSSEQNEEAPAEKDVSEDISEDISEKEPLDEAPKITNPWLDWNEYNLKVRSAINNQNLRPQSYYDFNLGRKAYVPSDSKLSVDLMFYATNKFVQNSEFKPAVAGVDLGFEYKKIWNNEKLTKFTGGVGMMGLDSFTGRIGVEHFFNNNFSVLANANYIHDFETDRSNFGVGVAAKYSFNKNNASNSSSVENFINFVSNSTNTKQTQAPKPEPQKIEQPESNDLPSIIGPADTGRGLIDDGRQM